MIDELKEQVNNMGISEKVYFAGYMGGKDVQKNVQSSRYSSIPKYV